MALFHNLNPKYSFSSTKADLEAFQKQLAEFDQEIAAKAKEVGKKMMAKVYEKAMQEIAAPPAIYGPSPLANAFATTNANYTTATIYNASTIHRAMAVMVRVKEEDAIVMRLPDWITTNRRRLAEALWVAEKVFENNLAAVAVQHRMRIRR